MDVDLLPTQEASFSEENLDDSNSNVWGQLLPLCKQFTALDMIEPEYVCGRAKTCALQFTKGPHLTAISKEHFKVWKVENKRETIVYLCDLSSNGTFVNKSKIGKGKIVVLNNDDEICVAVPHYKCFMFRRPNAPQPYPPEVVSKYTVTRLLGRGACGEVRQVFDRQSCRRLAMKMVEKKRFNSKFVSNVNIDIQREVDILRKLKHPNIIEVVDVLDTPSMLYIILEIVDGGELFDRVVELNQFTEDQSKFLTYQMLLAVQYLHDQNITHRDLKPENILLTDPESVDCLVKVTDFGLSKFLDGKTMLKTFCGTPNYLAPEILTTQGRGSYDKNIDVWSLGVITFICLVGYPPFTEERKDLPLTEQIMQGSYSFPLEFWSQISEQAIDLIKRMLTVDPNQRISIEEALHHPWYNCTVLKEKINDLYKSSNVTTFGENLSAAPSQASRKRPFDASTTANDSPKTKCSA